MSKSFGERNALRGFQINNIKNFSYATKITICFLLFFVLSVSLHVDHKLLILRNLRIIWTPPFASGNTTSLPAMKINQQSLNGQH